MEVYAASRRDLANAIQSYNDNDSITFISGAKVYYTHFWGQNLI